MIKRNPNKLCGCGFPEYKDGYCKQHYERRLRKNQWAKDHKDLLKERNAKAVLKRKAKLAVEKQNYSFKPNPLNPVFSCFPGAMAPITLPKPTRACKVCGCDISLMHKNTIVCPVCRPAYYKQAQVKYVQEHHEEIKARMRIMARERREIRHAKHLYVSDPKYNQEAIE